MNIHFTEDGGNKTRSRILYSLRTHNETGSRNDTRPFVLSTYDSHSQLRGGLVAQVWGNELEIQYLWVTKNERHKGHGKCLMLRAEEEARLRGCHISYVDTFDFQARHFYEKVGYCEYGKLEGSAGKFTRHSLAKKI